MMCAAAKLLALGLLLFFALLFALTQVLPASFGVRCLQAVSEAAMVGALAWGRCPACVQPSVVSRQPFNTHMRCFCAALAVLPGVGMALPVTAVATSAGLAAHTGARPGQHSGAGAWRHPLGCGANRGAQIAASLTRSAVAAIG